MRRRHPRRANVPAAVSWAAVGVALLQLSRLYLMESPWLFAGLFLVVACIAMTIHSMVRKV